MDQSSYSPSHSSQLSSPRRDRPNEDNTSWHRASETNGLTLSASGTDSERPAFPSPTQDPETNPRAVPVQQPEREATAPLLEGMATDAQPCEPMEHTTDRPLVMESDLDNDGDTSLHGCLQTASGGEVGHVEVPGPLTRRNDRSRRVGGFGEGSGTPVLLPDLPTEVLLHILGYLDVCDLLATSRTSHQFRSLALAPILQALRLRHTRAILPPLLWSPSRPSLADLIARSIFLTHTTVVSRKLARSLVAIRLSRRLAVRPSPEALVDRCVLPPECVPGRDGPGKVAPALVAKKRAVEREQVRDGLRRWVGAVWERRVKERAEGVRRWEERSGVGRVWRLRRFWERVGRGEGGQTTYRTAVG